VAILPIALFSAFTVFLGLRLTRRGMSSEGAELWLGLFFLFCGIAIVPRFALAMGADPGVDPRIVNLVAQAILHSGACCFAAFVWRTFRPGVGWARTLFGVIAVVYLVNIILFKVTGAYAIQSHPFHLVLSTCLASVFAWGFVETLLFYALMRKRALIGLGDPVVMNRFLLFTFWTGGLTFLPLVVTAVRVVSMWSSGQGFEVRPESGLTIQADSAWTLQVIRLSVLSVGSGVIASLWLAFFPPARYMRWVTDRANA
jgi:hypothetical protein